MSLSPAILDRDGTTFAPAKFVQSFHKSGDPLACGRRRTRTKKPDGRKLGGLLRACSKRPCCGSATKKCDEFPPFHGLSSCRGLRANERISHFSGGLHRKSHLSRPLLHVRFGS